MEQNQLFIIPYVISEESETRICRTCKTEKHLTAFQPWIAGRHSHYCRECARTSSKLTKAAPYEMLLMRQGGRCAICRIPAADYGRRFAVDHNHTTGEIRGLLCMHCNTGIGKFDDSITRLAVAIAYLSGDAAPSRQTW